MQNRPLILIADSHLGDDQQQWQDFQQLLNSIAKTDYDVVFLGDIFDLWIAMPRFENECHQAFLQWCKEQVNKRTIGFTEGNHEFFLTRYHSDCFTWCTTNNHIDKKYDIIFSHGDLVNSQDLNYLRFRKITKNSFTQFIFRFLPFAPWLVKKIKAKLKHTNHQFRDKLPEEELGKYAKTCFDNHIKTIFCGHFHCDYGLTIEEDRTLLMKIVPAWYLQQKVMHYNPKTNQTKLITASDI